MTELHMRLNSTIRDLCAILFVMSMPFIIIAIPLGAIYVALLVNACQTSALRKETISGLTYEIASRECDAAFGQEASIKIFISKENSGKKTLIFKYDQIFNDVADEYILFHR